MLGDWKKIQYATFWLAIVMLVIFSYMLGNLNANMITDRIHEYCSPDVNYTIGPFGDSVALWKDPPTDRLISQIDVGEK